MKKHLVKTALAAVAVLATLAAPAHAQLRITEVNPFGSGNGSSGGDWFEVTNLGASAVNIAGWKMDDNSNSFAASVALVGITSIAVGESVIFIEGTSSVNAGFLSFWFGANTPASLQIGNYSGSGVGLSQSGDAVNLFNAAGALQANVSFGASDGIHTFDNTAGLNNTTISQISAAGVNGGFVSANATHEIGSPGVVASVPEPEGYALALAGIAVVGAAGRRRSSGKAKRS